MFRAAHQCLWFYQELFQLLFLINHFYFEGSGEACAGRPAESRRGVGRPSVCVRSGAVQITGPASSWSRWASGGSHACCASETTVPSGSSADTPTVSAVRSTSCRFPRRQTDKRLCFTFYTAENEASRLILKVLHNRREKSGFISEAVIEIETFHQVFKQSYDGEE